MTLRKHQYIHLAQQSVVFPFIKLLGASIVALLGFIPAPLFADSTPIGRPANLRPLPALAIAAAASVSDNKMQGAAQIDAKFRHGTMVVLSALESNFDKDDVAVNDSVEMIENGTTIAIFHQLEPYANTHWTLGIRAHTSEMEADEPISSGGSRVAFTSERLSIEVNLLAEHVNWANSNGLQPYMALGIRQTTDRTMLETFAGRALDNSLDKFYSAHATAGLHWQGKRLSLFGELSAGSDDSDPWQAHLGVRFGFFHRPADGP